MDYRKLTDQQLQLEKKYLLDQIKNTVARIEVIANLLGMGHKSLSGLKLIEDLEIHYKEYLNLVDEIEYRRIP